MSYVLMAPMYKTMTSGKVDQFLVGQGDKVKVGMPIAEITAEGYFTLVSEWDGIVKEFFVGEGEYVEIHTPIMEIEVKEKKEEKG